MERIQGFSERWLKVNKQPITATHLSVKDLVELSDYEFRVCAENEAGVGKPSETSGVIKAKDPFDKPGQVLNLQATDVTKDSATLTWSKPKSDGNTDITNYVVECKAVGDFTWKQVGLFLSFMCQHLIISLIYYLINSISLFKKKLSIKLKQCSLVFIAFKSNTEESYLYIYLLLCTKSHKILYKIVYF